MSTVAVSVFVACRHRIVCNASAFRMRLHGTWNGTCATEPKRGKTESEKKLQTTATAATGERTLHHTQPVRQCSSEIRCFGSVGSNGNRMLLKNQKWNIFKSSQHFSMPWNAECILNAREPSWCSHCSPFQTQIMNPMLGNEFNIFGENFLRVSLFGFLNSKSTTSAFSYHCLDTYVPYTIL